MGYDMYCVRKDEGEQALIRQLNERWRAAIEKRDALPKPEWAPGEFKRVADEGGDFLNMLPASATDEYRAAQAEVLRIGEVRDRAEKGYFRLNIWGMRIYRDVMLGLGVARMDYSGFKWPEFDKSLPCWLVEYEERSDLSKQDPTLKPGERVLVRRKVRAIDPDEWYQQWRDDPKYRPDDYVEPKPDVVLLFEEHKAAHAAALQWRPDPADDFRIPLHKLGSNDGWLVTEEECFFAGNTLKTLRDAEPERFFTVLGAAGIKSAGERSYFDRWIDFLLIAAERGGFEVH